MITKRDIDSEVCHRKSSGRFAVIDFPSEHPDYCRAAAIEQKQGSGGETIGRVFYTLLASMVEPNINPRSGKVDPLSPDVMAEVRDVREKLASGKYTITSNHLTPQTT